ncbi:YoaK family protein [Sandarakinorhabdus oryzae]|uniref:YoaK family protein n=1 Tax=Sandarakinorhabdus oryzae TaxID=2675220 RepID=UPI0012E2BD0C|nr:YoaK family protein [Sandarakinorhabdus oryzae]
MQDHPRRDQLIAAALAALAGYVDAVGFIASGGLFVSFMSGNSTRLGIGLAEASHLAALAGSLLAAFVAGVTLATLTGRGQGDYRRRRQLLLVAALLSLGFGLATWGATWPALLLAAMAMGAENCVFEAGGDVKISLTFMTGNLVKIGQRLALALSGGPALAFLPWLLLWLAMIGGAVAGALAWPLLGLANLGVAAAIAAGLALLIDL